MLPLSSPPLRLLHVAELYPPDYGGGAALYASQLCDLLASRGHEVRVLTMEGTAAAPYTLRTTAIDPVRVDRLNLPYFRLNDPGGWQLGVRGWRLHQSRLRHVVDELLHDWQPDIVQFHTPYPVDEEFLLELHDRGLPLVGMTHCAWTICPRLNLLASPSATACSGPGTFRCLGCVYSHYDGSVAKALLKLPWRLLKLGLYPAYRLWRRARLRGRTQGLLTVSKYMAEVHRDHVRGVVQHVPLGIDLTGLPRQQPKRPRSPLRFGFMAGFQPHKGFVDIIEVAANLKHRGLPFELHVWGPQSTESQAVVSARGMNDQVFVHGLFDQAERWEAYAQIDVLVMATTVCEAYGRVIQEAAACHVPSVAPAVGGITEQINNGINGLLYRFRDRAHLELQLARLLQQPELVTQLASKLLPVLDTRDAVAGVEAFYHRILGYPRTAQRQLVSLPLC